MRTMIAVILAATIGCNVTTAAGANHAPSHVTKPSNLNSHNHGTMGALWGAGHMSAGSLGSKFGSSGKPAGHEQSKPMRK
jgi:hypothetical protein